MPPRTVMGSDGQLHTIFAPDGASLDQVQTEVNRQLSQRQQSKPESTLPQVQASDGGVLGRIMDRSGELASQRFGEEPIGIFNKALQNTGLVPRPGQSSTGLQRVNETFLRPAANVLEGATRFANSVVGGIAGAGGQTAGELGASQGMQRRLERDIGTGIDISGLRGFNAPLNVMRTATRAARKRGVVPPIVPEQRVANTAREMEGRIARAEDLGIDLTPGSATGSEAIKGAERRISNFPFSGAILKGKGQSMTAQIEAAKRRLTNGEVGDADVAGRAIKSDIDDFLDTQMNEIANQSYRPAWASLPEGRKTVLAKAGTPEADLPPEMTNTRKLLDERVDVRKSSGDPDADYGSVLGTNEGQAGTRLNNILQSAAQQTTAGGLREIRSEIGSMVGKVDAGGKPVIDPNIVKRLYGTITEDIKDVIRKTSGPDAVTAFEESDELFKGLIAQSTDLRKAIGNNEGESLLQGIKRLAGTSGTPNRRVLRLALSKLKKPQKETLGNHLLEDFGNTVTNEGVQFSPGRMVKEITKLNKSRGLEDIFEPAQVDGLRNLVEASKSASDIVKIANRTPGGNTLFTMGAAAGAYADPFSTIGGLLGARAAAKAVTKPAINKTIVKLMDAYSGVVDATKGGVRNTRATKRFLQNYRSSLNQLRLAMSEDTALAQHVDKLDGLELQETVSEDQQPQVPQSR